MLRVLHILTDSNIGGAGRLLVNYLHNFDREHFDIKVVLPKNAALKPAVEAEGYTVLETEHGADKSFDLKAIFEYIGIIKREKPDIVHTHSAFSGKLAAYLCGVKRRFYTRHCAFAPPKYLTVFPCKQINGFINGTLATDIVAVAQAAKDNLTETGVDEKKITVIINGVEPMRRTSKEERASLRASLGIEDDAFVLGISARLEDYKGHSYLLDTMKEVLLGAPRARLLIVGGGSCDAALRAQVEALGIADAVRFVGFVDDVAPYYNIMDLNLNCSWGTETSCLALSEGMSLSIPCVATDYGGNPYMVEHGVNGLLVPERNSGAMADAILKIISDEALYERLSRGALDAYHNKFTARKMTEQLEALYKRAGGVR